MMLNKLPIVARFDRKADSALSSHPEPLEHLQYLSKDLRPLGTDESLVRDKRDLSLEQTLSAHWVLDYNFFSFT